MTLVQSSSAIFSHTENNQARCSASGLAHTLPYHTQSRIH